MMCCSLGAFVMATMPMWRTWLKSTIGYAPTMTAAALAVVAWMFVAQHLTHYLDRAQANDRSLLAEVMAQPICSGAETTPIAAVIGKNERTASLSR
jgi:hypothetical protein